MSIWKYHIVKLASITLATCLMLSSPVSVKAQHQLSVYVDQSGQDTLRQCVDILKRQFNRSEQVELQTLPTSAFRGRGILLSSEPAKWPAYAPLLKRKGIEAVLVKSSGNGVVIIGKSQMAVQHGIFLYLEALGYRYFFPHPDWHIIPHIQTFFPKINTLAEPSFDHRRIWYGYGTGSTSATADYHFWFKANRQGGSVNANFGQAYDDIVLRNEKVFKEHPEWFYPKVAKGVLPDNPKFDVSNEELVKFVISDAIDRIEKSRKNGTAIYKMISMSPSDGPGVCNSPACQKIGTITDRVVYLANRVAKAIRNRFPDTWIGIYAYSEFITPPTIALEPNVFVGITTGFNYSKLSIEEIAKRWSAKARKTSIYDYYSIYAWDFDKPGQSLASRPDEMIGKLKQFYKLGVRGYEAESTTGWISKGLGHYLSAKLMWDIKANPASLKDEFFRLCFQDAAQTMKKLWAEWESFGLASPRQSDLARWIDLVYKAQREEDSQQVQSRLFQVKSYLYYLVLLGNSNSSGEEAALVKLLSYGSRMTPYGSFAGYPSLWQFGNLTKFPGMKFADPKAKWKSNLGPVTPAELDNLLKQERSRLVEVKGLSSFPLGTTFVKAPGSEQWKGPLHDGTRGDNAIWYAHDFVLQVLQKGKQNFLDLSGNYVTGGGGERPIKISVSKYTTVGGQDQPILLKYDYNGLKDTQRISLASLPPGTYRLKINDPGKIFRLKFSGSLNYSILITQKQRLNSTFSNNLFIYVPTGTSKFSLWKTIGVKFVTPTGRIVDLTKKMEEEAEIKVLPGEQGIWKLNFFVGSLYLEGIPPVIGTVPDHMLIPASAK